MPASVTMARSNIPFARGGAHIMYYGAASTYMLGWRHQGMPECACLLKHDPHGTDWMIIAMRNRKELHAEVTTGCVPLPAALASPRSSHPANPGLDDLLGTLNQTLLQGSYSFLFKRRTRRTIFCTGGAWQ